MAIWQFISLFSWTSTLLVMVTVLLLTWLVLTEPWRHLPPGPPALPVIGSLLFLGDADARKAFRRLAEKYGDIFTLYFGHNRAVVINGYDNIRDALIKSGNSFLGRPYIFTVDLTLQQAGIGLNQGYLWQEQRRFVLHILKDYGYGRRTSTDLILDESTYMLDEFQSLMESGQPFSPKPVLHLASFNIISQLVFGKRNDYHDPELLEFVDVARETLKLCAGNSLLNIFPYLRHIPGNLVKFDEYKKCSKFLLDRHMRIIDDHQKKLASGEAPDDIVGAYLEEMERQKSQGSPLFSVKQLRGIMCDLSFGGSDTTSDSLSWLLLHMVLHPDIQHKVHKELDEVVGESRRPTIEDRSKLPYVEALTAEILRLKNVLPLSVPHSPTEDVVFKGYDIPKGTMVFMNLNSVDMDPGIWENPEEFNPARFLDDQGDYVKKDELNPFSMGKRVCLGETLARMTLFLFFTSLMHKFRFRLPEDRPRPSTDGFMGFTYQPEIYHVIAELRD